MYIYIYFFWMTENSDPASFNVCALQTPSCAYLLESLYWIQWVPSLSRPLPAESSVWEAWSWTGGSWNPSICAPGLKWYYLRAVTALELGIKVRRWKNVGESVGNIKAADGSLESLMKARGKQENEGEDGSDVNDVALFFSSAWCNLELIMSCHCKVSRTRSLCFTFLQGGCVCLSESDF